MILRCPGLRRGYIDEEPTTHGVVSKLHCVVPCGALCLSIGYPNTPGAIHERVYLRRSLEETNDFQDGQPVLFFADPGKTIYFSANPSHSLINCDVNLAGVLVDSP